MNAVTLTLFASSFTIAALLGLTAWLMCRRPACPGDCTACGWPQDCGLRDAACYTAKRRCPRVQVRYDR